VSPVNWFAAGMCAAFGGQWLGMLLIAGQRRRFRAAAMSTLLKSTLLARCYKAHGTAAPWRDVSLVGVKAVVKQIAAELNGAGHRDAARFLLEQLSPKVVPLHPPGDGCEVMP
jgi:hypothetical protein